MEGSRGFGSRGVIGFFLALGQDSRFQRPNGYLESLDPAISPKTDPALKGLSAIKVKSNEKNGSGSAIFPL
jgi:hypothetical protein